MPASLLQQKYVVLYSFLIHDHFIFSYYQTHCPFPPTFFFFFCRGYFFLSAELCIGQLKNCGIVAFQTTVSNSLIFFCTNYNSVLEFVCSLSYFINSYMCNNHGPPLKQHLNQTPAEAHLMYFCLFTMKTYN